MKTIPSFTIDHIRLLRGIYVSRKDQIGNYLLMKGDLESKDIVELMKETFRFIAEYEGEIPGAAPKDCGNYLLQDLPMAKWEAAKYLHEVLENIKEENLIYPA